MNWPFLFLLVQVHPLWRLRNCYRGAFAFVDQYICGGQNRVHRWLGIEMENRGRASTMGWGLAMLLALAMVHLVSTTDHIVGGNRGWNPGINYTNWVKNETFVVGDWISFRYQRYQYNVLQVNESGYDNCTTDNPIGNWSSGKDFIELNESKRYYFICGTGFCYGGMKITFFVNKTAPAPAASPQAAEKNNTSNDGWSIPADKFKVLTVVLFVGALLF